LLTKFGLPVVASAMLVFAIVMVVRSKPVRRIVAPPAPPPAAVWSSEVAAVGIVEAASENIAISLPVSGLVTHVFVHAGDKVARGAALFSLDDRDLRAELALRQSELELARRKLERIQKTPRPEEIPPAEARVREAEAQAADAETQLRLMEGVEDKRAIRNEDLERRRAAVPAAKARVEEAQAALALLKAGPWQPDVEVARAEVEEASRNVDRVRTGIERLTVSAPIAGEILQSKIRAGEYAQAGALPQPLMLMGATGELRLRVDVSEEDAGRVSAQARATASPRGDSAHKFPLHFVRFEPYVIPKKELTGDSVERVDTRVLQVIYALGPGTTLFAGQRMDVFIEAPREKIP